MGRRSSIDRLDPKVRAELAEAIKRGATIEEIVECLKAVGADVSRSAVGRYTKQYRELAARQRDMQAVAEAFGREFGQDGDPQSRLMVQLLTSVITRSVMPIASDMDDQKGVDAKDLHFLARAVKDAISAAKIDVDREAKVREEAAKKARAAAATAAENAGRKAGATPETIAAIKREILGLKA